MTILPVESVAETVFASAEFVLYSAPKKEITALALDKEGNIYAAGVGEKRAG